MHATSLLGAEGAGPAGLPQESARFGPVGATSGSMSFLCQAVTGLDFWEGLG
jgi:hypothetical protein